MNCYFIRYGKAEEQQNQAGKYNPYVQLSLEDKDKIYQSSKLITGELENKNGRVSIISEDNMAALEVALVVKQLLGVPNNKVFVDERLNDCKNINGRTFGKKPETKEEYTSRIFDAITEIIMTHENDDAVIVVAGEHLFKTCQKDEGLHTLMYFGDEFMVRPFSPFYTTNIFGDFANFDMSELISYHCLASKKEQKPLEFEKVVLEAPEIDAHGYVKPVYLKYAEQKLAEEIKAENESSAVQKGE